jgi:hypothetical protein
MLSVAFYLLVCCDPYGLLEFWRISEEFCMCLIHLIVNYHVKQPTSFSWKSIFFWYKKGFSIISKTRRSICTKWHLCGAPFSDPTLEEDFLLAFLTLSVLKCLAVTIYVAYYKLIYLATIKWFMYSPWPFSLLHSGCFQQDSTYDTATIIQGPMI